MNYYGAKELANSFRTVRKNTIQTAEDIPEVYCPRVLGQWFDGIRFYAAASSPTRSRRTWAGLR